MKQINLSEMTKGEVDILLGFDYGSRARSHYKLDDIDNKLEAVIVSLPDELRTFTPSFAQGFFGKSALVLGGKEEFFKIYNFEGWSEDLIKQVESGIMRALMKRGEATAH